MGCLRFTSSVLWTLPYVSISLYFEQACFSSTLYPWNKKIYHLPSFSMVVETCTSSSGQPCSSFSDGSFLCSARGNFLNPQLHIDFFIWWWLGSVEYRFYDVTIVFWRFSKRFWTTNLIRVFGLVWRQELMLISKSGKTRSKRKSLKSDVKHM